MRCSFVASPSVAPIRPLPPEYPATTTGRPCGILASLSLVFKSRWCPSALSKNAGGPKPTLRTGFCCSAPALLSFPESRI
jgi:hypothetical protein